MSHHHHLHHHFPDTHPLTISRLISGGLITTYSCSSSCRHCLYRCHPGRERQHIDTETTSANLKTIDSLGCDSIHIGGGEPFLDFASLLQILELCQQHHIQVEYIETNASWFNSIEQVSPKLRELLPRGVSTLLISISPFHNEHIRFSKTKGLIQACRRAGLNVFPWISGFIDDMEPFDENKTHSLKEFRQHFGAGYDRDVLRRYWISPGGRALEWLRNVWPLKSLNTILDEFSQPCHELAETSHFHIDLYGNYVPGLCSGLAIRREDLGSPLDPKKYPLITLLYHQGIQGLYALAQESFGFHPRDDYIHKCELCDHIRTELASRTNEYDQELAPREFYQKAKIHSKDSHKDTTSRN
jgi:hypothetical protein